MFKIPVGIKNNDIININGRMYEYQDGKLSAKSEVTIGGGVTAEDMDGVVDFLSDTYEKLQDNVIDLTVNNFFLKELTSNIKFEVIPRGAASNSLNKFYLQIRDGGSYIIEWFGDVRWPGGVAPELSRGESDLLMFYSYNNGKTWFGNLISTGIDDNIPPEFTNIASAYTSVSVDTTDNIAGIIKDTSGKLFTYSRWNYCWSSEDGKKWKRHTIVRTGATFDLYDVKFINGLYYGVGESGYVGTSPDMINWTEVAKLGATRWTQINLYNDTMVITGGSSNLYTSTNGLNWTKVTIPVISSHYISKLVYKDDYYYILYNNKIIRSNDLVTWIEVDVGIPASSYTYLRNLVLLNNKLFIVVLDNNVDKYLTSSDGVVWMDDDYMLPAADSGMKITQIDNLFIASQKVNGDNTSGHGIFLSTDMKNWRPIENSAVRIPAGMTSAGTVMNMSVFNVVDNVLAIAGERGYFGYATLEVV